MAHELNRQSYTDPYRKYGLKHDVLDTDFSSKRMATPEILTSNFNHNLNIDQVGLTSKKLTFGTPSYPSPLDRIRTGRYDRANQFGLLTGKEASFEGNQSFPKVNRGQICLDETMSKPKTTKMPNHGTKLNDVSYSPVKSKGSFLNPHDSSLNMSNSENWSFYNYLGGHTGSAFPTTVRNPNKAICTINAKTSEILIANDIACVLFGYDLEDLIGKHLKDLIKLKPKDQATISESHLDEVSGEMVTISGKVVDAYDSEGIVMAISIWVRKLNCKTEPRCLVVMEPVERTVAMVTFNNKGVILSCDHQLASLHGFESPDDLEGLDMTQLIPSFNVPKTGKSLPKEIRKQRATGRTRDGVPFPLSISVKMASEIEDDPRNVPPNTGGCYDNIYLGIVWVFSSISGLITFLPDGRIQSINENFAHLLFGYNSDELIGKHISVLIPEISEILEDKGFRQPMEDLGDDDNAHHIKKKNLTETDHSEDQGIGSSIASNQMGKIELPVDGLGDLKPGITSTPNKGLPDLFLRKALDSENSKSIKHISPLADDPLALKLNLDSDSETDEIVKPLYKSDVRSPVRLSDVSTSSVETIPTAREVKKFFPPISPDAGGEIPAAKINQCEDGKTKNTSSENLRCDRIDLDLSDIESDNDPAELSSTSTTELLSMKVAAVNIHSVEDLLNKSILSDQDDFSSPEIVADVSNNCQSSSGFKEATDDSCDDNKKTVRGSGDYIPPCVNNPIDSSTSSEFSDDEHPVPKQVLSPLVAGSSWEERGTDSNLTDMMPEYDTSVTDSHDIYSTSDSMQIANQSLSYSKTRSPRKHRRRHWEKKSVEDLHKSSGICEPSSYTEGSFAGACVHKDGSHLGVIFQVKKVELEDGTQTYCMWVSRDPEDAPEYGKSFTNLTLASSFNSTMDKSNCSFGETSVDKNGLNEKDQDEAEEEKSPGRGLYDLKYDTMESIGKGAFGFVKTALRKTDGREVVVKFIRKGKVLSECWITERTGEKIPMEVGLLRKLNHPNIVSVIDVFENDDYVQMVMEKHGSGMDLFEFIDRSPLLDEALASYIFRQMVSAISYLHNQNILHRDVKDENVILNENFQIKLIDFGAAAYMDRSKLFGTFCGTLEYCSPEVLMGNKYKGPELEMWSMGVTLYTLVFGENPFFDVDETIQCVLKPPFVVSRPLMFLLMGLLHPDPRKRTSMRDCEKDLWVNQPIDITLYKWEEILPNSEFHGNTASDNRLDSPDVHKDQNKWLKHNHMVKV